MNLSKSQIHVKTKDVLIGINRLTEIVVALFSQDFRVYLQKGGDQVPLNSQVMMKAVHNQNE